MWQYKFYRKLYREEAIKSSQVSQDGQPDVTHFEDITRQAKIVENQPNLRRSLKEPPIVKLNGKPGRRKSWIDKLNRERKNKETRKKPTSKDSPRLPVSTSVEMDNADSKDKQQKKTKKSSCIR
ncbi:hypothetical protein C5167_012761 [Papaver somniferum]|uniref:Uncharacterized protein n=1 Tax=Papaver somniferum TaxID=3469 RepID=A0A4Y7IZ82_PAPSO|nr:hypothetical protein C5167_012761 [Papaver somniferum]